MRFGFLIVGILAFATPAMAQSVGLLIGNEDYQTFRDIRRGDRIPQSAESLSQAGIEVISRHDVTYEDLQWALAEFGQMVEQSDTVVIALGGRFVHSASETYYLPVDAEPGPLVTLPARSLPISTVLAWLAAKPGKGILVLSTEPGSVGPGAFLNDGIGEFAVPEGVTVLVGRTSPAARTIRNVLTRRGKPFVGAARQLGMKVRGLDDPTLVLLDVQSLERPRTAADRAADILAWRRAAGQNTVVAYEDYIEANPDGEFVRMAENRIRGLVDTPQARAERTEQALDLSRNARRDIQRNLTLLNYPTRGIDGIFGRGTRAAITGWQRDQRLLDSGYLTRDQIAALNQQAEARARELEAEAERRRQEQLAADLDYWDRTGRNGDEAGLRAYLEKFPDGEFSEVAEERLANIEEQKRDQASRFDRRLWRSARDVNSVAGYEEYLRRMPDGAFRAEALARIESMEAQQQNSAEVQRAQRGEQAMNLSPRTRQIVEARLNGLGLKPGPVDGVFDADTRRAIRRYQSARNMQETGYLSDAVVVQLMADTVRQFPLGSTAG